MRKLVAVLLLLWVAGAAQAASVTWTFTGIFRDNASQLPNGSTLPLPAALTSLGVVPGAPVSGFIQFDPDTPNILAPGVTAYYENPIQATSLTIGSWVLHCDLGTCPTASLTNYISVNGSAPGGAQFSAIDVNESSGTLGTTTFALELSKSTPGPTLWPGNAMLVTPPPLSAVDPYGFGNGPLGYGSDIYILAAMGNNELQLRAEITSLVPEPEVFALVALAIAALSARYSLRPRFTHSC
jgi:hypothetical protein